MKITTYFCDICREEITYNNEPDFLIGTNGKEKYRIKDFKIEGYVRVPSVSEPYAWKTLETVCKQCVKKIVIQSN